MTDPVVFQTEVRMFVAVGVATVGLMGCAIASSITSAGVFPVAGIVSPVAYLPKVLPPERETVRSLGKT